MGDSEYEQRLTAQESAAVQDVANYLREHPTYWRIDAEVLRDKIIEDSTVRRIIKRRGRPALRQSVNLVRDWHDSLRPQHISKAWKRLIERAELSVLWWNNRIALRYSSLDWSELPTDKESDTERDKNIVTAVYRMHTYLGVTTKCSVGVLNTLLPHINKGLLGRRLKVLASCGFFEYEPGTNHRTLADGTKNHGSTGIYSMQFSDMISSFEFADTYCWEDTLEPLDDTEISSMRHYMSQSRRERLEAVEQYPDEKLAFPRPSERLSSRAEDVACTALPKSRPAVGNKAGKWSVNRHARAQARLAVDEVLSLPLRQRYDLAMQGLIWETSHPWLVTPAELEHIDVMRLVSKSFREWYDGNIPHEAYLKELS